MEVAFITTVLNEEENILFLLKSLQVQTKKPDEIIIVDGGSKDKTIEVIKEWISRIRSNKFRESIRLIMEKGNRSKGRNEAVEVSKSEIIVCSDSGCILDKNWIKNIVKPFRDQKVDVVAGYYKGLPNSNFQKALIPYILVMPDKVDPKNFLPSTRSLAFKKLVWKKVGGFPLQFSNNEDFVFSRKLKNFGAKIIFKKNALVYYLPRKNIIESFLMFFKFAKGDSEAGILRPKVALIFLRYGILIWLLIYASFFKLFFILEVILYILILYVIWAIVKNYKYVKNREAILLLPLIQVTSDFAVILGSFLGFIGGVWDTRRKR